MTNTHGGRRDNHKRRPDDNRGGRRVAGPGKKLGRPKKMTIEQRQAIVQSGVEIAIQRGHDAFKVQRFAGNDTNILLGFVHFGDVSATAEQIADYIINELEHPSNDGGAPQADWTPMGNLHSLKSTLRDGG